MSGEVEETGNNVEVLYGERGAGSNENPKGPGLTHEDLT